MEVETGWGDHPQTFNSVLDEMVSAGYQGTELGPWGFLPIDPKRLNSELSDRNLQLIGAFVPIALSEPESYSAGRESALRTARLLAESYASVLVLADVMCERRMAVAGRVEEKDEMPERAWDSAATLLEEISAEVRALGLQTVFHHHAGTYVETPSEVERLLSRTDPSLLGLCLDTGHYFYGGGNPVDIAHRYGSRIRHVHLKDIRAEVLCRVRREQIGFLDSVGIGVFCPLGEGTVDIIGVVGALEKHGYSGWAVFEQDVDPTRPGIVPLKSAIASRQYLSNIIAP